MLQKEVIKIEAITREEVLLQSIAEGKEATLEPKTRLEWWLKKIAENGGSGGVSSWNDLTDKPFYKEETGFNIEWDGDTTGKIVLGDGAIVKVSDLVPSDEEAKNGTITFIADGEEQTIKVSEIKPFGDDNFLSLELVTIVKKDNYTSDIWGCTFPEKGVYFINAEGVCTTSFSSKSTVIKTLDKEYIPSVAEQLSNGDATNVLTWDGNTTGKEVVGSDVQFVKMFDEFISIENLLGGNLTFIQNGVSTDVAMSSENVVDGSAMGLDGAVIVSYNNLPVVVSASKECSLEGMTFNKGVWFQYYVPNAEMSQYTEKITTITNVFGNITYEQIPVESIPELSHFTMVSSTGKKYKVTIDDTGAFVPTEITE